MTKFNLSKKIWKCEDGYHPAEEVLIVEDVRKFIKKRQDIKDEFECKVVGLVWGLSYNTNFNVKKFNLQFDEIRKEARKKADKLVGDKLHNSKKE